MNNLGLAKSDKTVTIKKHADDLLNLLDDFLYKYNVLTPREIKLLKIACMYHDIGKYNIKFQNKVYKYLRVGRLKDYAYFDEIPHEFLSVLIFTESFIKKHGLSDEDALIIVIAIISHHGRFIHLVDYISELRYTIKNDLKPNLKFIQKDFPEIEDFQVTPQLKMFSNRKKRIRELKDRNIDAYHSYIKIKGLLNKLDYGASAGLETIEVKPKLNGKYLYEIIMDKFKGNLRDIQKYMYKNHDKNLVVVGSTGIGKTEASIFWARDRKVFYILPIRVAIDAIHKRIVEEFGYNLAQVYHSDASDYYFENLSDQEQASLEVVKARLQQSPCIVTTVDQLFKFAYQSEFSEKELVTASYSKVIIDELPLYDARLVGTILVGLKKLTDIGGQFAIVTATMPKLFLEKMKELDIPFEESPEKFYRKDKNGKTYIQHKVELKDTFDYELIKNQSKENKVLLVANTVKEAQKLYEYFTLEDKAHNVNLIHSRYILKDRIKKEDEILRFADKHRSNKENGLWIATSIIEASLDIDFDILHTETTVIDSLLKRMGRVFRHRIYKKDLPNIYIYLKEHSGVINGEDCREILWFTINALKKMITKKGFILTEEKKQRLMDFVYDEKYNSKILSSNYNKTLNEQIKYLSRIEPYDVCRDNVNSVFRNIDSQTIMPFDIFDKLRSNGTFKKWYDWMKTGRYNEARLEFKKHLVNVPGYFLNDRKHAEIKELRYISKNIYVVRIDYNSEYGINVI